MPAAQTTRSAGRKPPLAVCTPLASTAVTRSSVHGNIEAAEKLGCGARDFFAELRQDARRGFEQGQVDVLFGIELVQSVADVRAGGLANFGSELDPGGSGADDHDIDARELALR